MNRIFQSIERLEKAIFKLEDSLNSQRNEPLLPFDMIPKGEIEKVKKKFVVEIDELKNKNRIIEDAALNASANLEDAIVKLKQMLHKQ